MNKNIILLMFAIVLVGAIYAQVPTFHQFYGNVVNESGTPLTSAVSIKAYVNNNLVATTTSLADGTYGYNPLFFIEDNLDLFNDQVITFTIEDTFSSNYTFVAEESTYLDLMFNQSGSIICTDIDNDNYNISEDVVSCGVNDCNDTNSAMNQGATDVCGNGIDENCDGSDAVCQTQQDDGDGGGGGGGTTTTKTFTIDKETLSFTVEQGSTQTLEFIVTNNGSVSMTFSITQSMGTMLDIGSGFTLAKGESKSVRVLAFALSNQDPNLYVGHIYVTSGTIKKEIAVSLEVISKESLFDVVLNLPDSLYAKPGSQIDADISLTRLAESQGDEVQVTYIIKDENDAQVFSETETVTVETVIDFVKTLTLPDTLRKGKYVLYAQVNYGSKVASSSDWFNVGDKTIVRKVGESIRPYIWWIIMALIVLSIIAIVIVLIAYMRREQVQGEEPTSTATIQKQFS